ncbi:MAG: DUF2662 domain-containing protein [Nitriliruptorales bacterium]|nr:DUF2662 domain-containing protein [Nitriliruptorales bacterium]
MSILRDFEKRLEGAVEGFFARAFRSGLQPVELAKALQRYAANYQQVGLEGVFVPNVYRFVLSPDDLERFEGFTDSLRAELSEVVSRTVTDRDWRLKGPLRIEFVEGEHIRTGTYELRGKVEAGTEVPRPIPAPAAVPSSPRPARSAGSEAPLGSSVLQAAPAQLVSADGRRHPLGETTLVGRLPECDITLEDAAVSRRHARITHDGVAYQVEDLGSTNGVRVNGQPVTRTALRGGDQLDFGGVRFTFSSGR